MKFYSYDEEGYFLGEIIGQRNPAYGELGQPEYLQPGKTTKIQPPEAAENKIQKFVDGSWVLVDSPDYLAAEEQKEADKIMEEKIKTSQANELARQASIASAKAKLAALGLTNDEIKAILSM